MHDLSVTWRPDGFRLHGRSRRFETAPLSWIASMYALCVPALLGALAEPALVPLLGAFLLPLPAALALAALRPFGGTVLDVDHRRIVIRGPLGRRRVVPLRAIRAIEVRVDGIEIALVPGDRVHVAVGAPLSRLAWLAARLGELCEEVRAFESEAALSRGEGAAVLALAHAAVRSR